MDTQTTPNKAKPLIGIGIACLLAAIVAYMGSSSGIRLSELSLYALCALGAFVVQWLAFVPAFIYQTEKYYDLMGALTYMTITGIALSLGNSDARSLLIAALVFAWSGRLGLFLRIQKAGSDRRFDVIKPNPTRFLMTWTLQGLWVVLSLASALVVFSSTKTLALDAYALVGALCWLAGFTIEVVADRQKSAFRSDPDNEQTFIQSGLWAWSRHPNYFGEILLWIGISIIALPILQGSQYVTLISPLFVYFLLTKISGIPLLEARADKVWGEDEQYLRYKKRTPALMLKRPDNG